MEKERISPITAGLMVGLAGLLDVVQFGCTFILNIIVPGSGFIIASAVTIFGFIVFFVWFMLCGVTILSGKNPLAKFLGMLGFAVIEFIPLLNAIPGLSGWVITTLVQVRLEDKGIGKDRATAIRERFVETKKLERQQRIQSAAREEA